MRIAIVGNFGLTGKQTMAVRALPLAEALAARGHLVCMALPIRREGDRHGPRERNGVQLRYAGRAPAIPGLVELWQAIRLAWLAWRWQPEVLYCFKPIAHAGSVLALFWWLRRLHLLPATTALALDADDWEGRGGWNDRQPFPGWLKRVIAWQEGWSLRHADAVTVASRALIGLAEKAGARNVVYLPNAVADSVQRLVPADRGLRGRLGLEEQAVVLLYTRFFEFSLHRVLEVFQGVLRQIGEGTLLVVGQGLQREENLLRELARGQGIEDRLRFAGWVPPEQLPSYFAAADVALYPLDDTLLNRTKCPVKLLDLLAAGVPVVADRVGQAIEYIADGRTGVLVAPGDASAMAEATAALLRNPARRKALGEAARAETLARWNWRLWAVEAERVLQTERLRAGTAD